MAPTSTVPEERRPPCGSHARTKAVSTCAGCGLFLCEACVEGAEAPRCLKCRADGHPIPWEDPKRGRVKAFAATVRKLIAPDRFFSEAPWTGGLKGPLYFALIASFLGSFFSTVFGVLSALVTEPVMNAMVGSMLKTGAFRGEQRRLIENLMEQLPVMKDMMVQTQLSQLALNPLETVVQIFVLAALSYPIARYYGGQGSFEGTFRVIAYGKGATIASAIPGMGGALAFLWGIILVMVGMRRAHGLTAGKAFIVAVWWFPFALIAFLLTISWMLSVAHDLMLGS